MHQISIIEAPTLRWVLGRVRGHFGSDRKAATALGIGQPVFTRLRNGTTQKRLRFDTYCSIRDALVEHRIEFGLLGVFQDCVLTWEGSQVLLQYEKWLRAEYDRLEPKVGSVFAELYGHPDYRTLFEGFLKEVTKGSKPAPVVRRRRVRQDKRFDLGPNPPVKHVAGVRLQRIGGIEDSQATATLPGRQGPQENRVWVALYRAVEPLGDTHLTWGVERTWQEMHEADDLRNFLKAALRREQIMLKRERDLERINKCSPPDEYLEWLAGPEEEGARYMPAAELLEGLEGEGGEGEKSE